ncbi:MAG: RsmE family RNA methyltransferase [Planctomycetota bacterium]
MGVHTLFVSDLDFSDDHLTVGGPEAEHAVRVKRVGVGDRVRLLNGTGDVLTCVVSSARKREMQVDVECRERAEKEHPAVHVMGATPKGPRLEKMIDQLAQVGAASWSALATKLGVVDPGANKLDRMVRVATEGAKQSGRAWIMDLGGKTTLERALEGDASLVVCDGSGGAYRPTGAAAVRVLVGPEGGFLPEEIEMVRQAGGQVLRLGPHAMRIETASVVGASRVLCAEQEAAAAGSGTAMGEQGDMR